MATNTSVEKDVARKTDEEVIKGVIGLVVDMLPKTYIERLDENQDPRVYADELIDVVLSPQEQEQTRDESHHYPYYLRHDFDLPNRKERAALEGAAYKRLSQVFEALGETVTGDDVEIQ